MARPTRQSGSRRERRSSHGPVRCRRPKGSMGRRSGLAISIWRLPITTCWWSRATYVSHGDQRKIGFALPSMSSSTNGCHHFYSKLCYGHVESHQKLSVVCVSEPGGSGSPAISSSLPSCPPLPGSPARGVMDPRLARMFQTPCSLPRLRRRPPKPRGLVGAYGNVAASVELSLHIYNTREPRLS